MGMTTNPKLTGMASPRIAICAAPTSFKSLRGDIVGKEHQDITIRVISSGDTHRASPLTSAMCLGAACRINGTIPFGLTKGEKPETRIGNPSGVLTVGADVVLEHGGWSVRRTYSYRTQRRLMEGTVLV